MLSETAGTFDIQNCLSSGKKKTPTSVTRAQIDMFLNGDSPRELQIHRLRQSVPRVLTRPCRKTCFAEAPLGPGVDPTGDNASLVWHGPLGQGRNMRFCGKDGL